MSERYILSLAADRDLVEIAEYTIAQWGVEQSDAYCDDLLLCVDGMACGALIVQHPLEWRDDIVSRRCGHHYVFAEVTQGAPLHVIAIFHVSMDIPARLADRLKLL